MGDAPQLRVLPGTAGPRNDFRRLFDEHHGFVRRSLLTFGIAPSLADDATQEVFVVVYRRLDEFDGRTSFRSWLYGVARRVAFTIARGEYRTQRKALAFAQEEPSAPDLDAELARRRAIGLVEGFLASLDQPLREVFGLMQIEGLSAPETAEALGIKLNTVYSRLRLARGRFERFVALENER